MIRSEDTINMWLDDVRDPFYFGAVGYVWVKTVPEAQALLETGKVWKASLDHDLGCCEVCRQGMSDEEWLTVNSGQSMPNCEHFGTGYTLCCWMEETGNWPLVQPEVHSANPVGAARMRQVINRHYRD